MKSEAQRNGWLSGAWDTPGGWDADGSDAPLSADEHNKLLTDITQQVARRGLQTPVLWALEMHRPLAFTAGQTLVALTPLLGPLIGAARLQKAARLLCEPGFVDELTARIEETESGKP